MFSTPEQGAGAEEERSIFRDILANHTGVGFTDSGSQYQSLASGPHLLEFLAGIVTEDCAKSLVTALRKVSEAYVNDCITHENPVNFRFQGEFEFVPTEPDESLVATISSRAALFVLRAYNSLSGVVGGCGFVSAMKETIKATQISFTVLELGHIMVKFRITGVDAVGHADFIVGCIAFMAKMASFGSLTGLLDSNSISCATTLLVLMTGGLGMRVLSPLSMVNSMTLAVKAWNIREMPRPDILDDWALTMFHGADPISIQKLLVMHNIPTYASSAPVLVSLGSVTPVLDDFETWKSRGPDRKYLKISFHRVVDERLHFKLDAGSGSMHKRANKLFGVLPLTGKQDWPEKHQYIRVRPSLITTNSWDPLSDVVASEAAVSDTDMPLQVMVRDNPARSEAEDLPEEVGDEEYARALDLTSGPKWLLAIDLAKTKEVAVTSASSSGLDMTQLMKGYFANLKSPPHVVAPKPEPAEERSGWPVSPEIAAAWEGAVEEIGFWPSVTNNDDENSAASSLPLLHADYRVKKVLATFASCSRISPENSEQLYTLMKARPAAVRNVLKHHFGLDASQVDMVDKAILAAATRDIVAEFSSKGAGGLYLTDLAVVRLRQSMMSTIGIMNTCGLLQIYGALVEPIPLLDAIAIRKHVAKLALRGARAYLNPPFTLFFGIHALRVADEIAATGLAAQIIVVLSVTATPSTDDASSMFNGIKYPAIAAWPGRYGIFSVLQKDFYLMVLLLVGADESPYDVLCALLGVVPGVVHKTIAVKLFGRQGGIVIGTQDLYTKLAAREEAQVGAKNFENLVDQVASDLGDLLWWP